MPARVVLLHAFDGVVVGDQVNIKAFRYGLIDALGELKRFSMTMACPALRQNRTGGNVKGGKQGRGAIANVVVGHAFHVSKSNGQHRLCPVED